MKAASAPLLDSPIVKAAVGWLRNADRRDATEFAKGYAAKHFDAPEIAWFATMPFLGGQLWEVHEGGPGLSYLGPAVRALTEGAEQAWFAVANRAFSISLRDGEPFCVLLPTDQSRPLIESGIGRLAPRGQMLRVIKQGNGALVAGTTIFSSGFLFLAASLAFYVAGEIHAPKPRRLDLDNLPHRAWSRVDRVPPNLFVESLRFDRADKKGWTANMRPILPKGTDLTPKAPVSGGPAPQPLPPPGTGQPAARPLTPSPVPAGAASGMTPGAVQPSPQQVQGQPPPIAPPMPSVPAPISNQPMPKPAPLPGTGPAVPDTKSSP